MAVSVPPALRAGETILGPGLEKNASGFRSVRRRRSQRACHRGKTPLLHICLDEHETGLTEIDVNNARPVRADGWEEVLGLEAVHDIIQLLAIACEEDGPRPWSVSDT